MVFVSRCVLMMSLLSVAGWTAAQKPEFKLGAVTPKYLPNHQTTTVHWAGTNFAGVQLTWRGACKVLSYTSTATEIVMQIQAERPLDDKSGYCNLYLRNRFGSTDSWVMVNFTDADQKQVKAVELARSMSQIKAEMMRAGTEWTVHMPDGSTKVFHAGTPNQFGVVPFKDDSGTAITIIVLDDDSTVLQFPNGCNLLGKLKDGRVENGFASRTCAASGTWSAEMR